MSNRRNGHRQIKVKLVAHRARRHVLLNIAFLGLEGRVAQWRSALVDRLCDFARQRPAVGRAAKTLVLCVYWIRSVFTRLSSSVEYYMATLEPEKPEGEIQACDWCRMGVHKKCDKLTKLHAICICLCERGY